MYYVDTEYNKSKNCFVCLFRFSNIYLREQEKTKIQNNQMPREAVLSDQLLPSMCYTHCSLAKVQREDKKVNHVSLDALPSQIPLKFMWIFINIPPPWYMSIFFHLHLAPLS